MGHELVAEFCRAHTFDQGFLRRCQRVFREDVQAQLDERELLLEENARLTAELDALNGKSRKKGALDHAGVSA